MDKKLKGTIFYIRNLYMDNDKTEHALVRAVSVCRNNSYQYAYALHDKDNCKSHYHFYFRIPNARSVACINALFNIPDFLIVSVSNEDVNGKKDIFNYCVRYLIHADQKEKHQYELSVIQSNFNLQDYFKDFDTRTGLVIEKASKEEMGMQAFIELLRERPSISEFDLIEFAITNHFYTVYRMNRAAINDIRHHFYVLATESQIYDDLEKSPLTREKIAEWDNFSIDSLFGS